MMTMSERWVLLSTRLRQDGKERAAAAPVEIRHEGNDQNPCVNCGADLPSQGGCEPWPCSPAVGGVCLDCAAQRAFHLSRGQLELLVKVLRHGNHLVEGEPGEALYLVRVHEHGAPEVEMLCPQHDGASLELARDLALLLTLLTSQGGGQARHTLRGVLRAATNSGARPTSSAPASAPPRRRRPGAQQKPAA